MKLSIVLSTQPASFSALAYKGKIAENLKKIKSLGYDGVELAVRDPKLLDISEIKTLASDYKLPVPAIGTGQAYGEEGLAFIHKNHEIRGKAIDRIKAQIEFANNFDAVVIIGLIRGVKDPEMESEVAEKLMIDALIECAASNKRIKMAIEPINRYETDMINTVKSGLELLEKVKMENVGLLLDTFHMNIEEPSIVESIIAAKDRLFHFHVADSNRWHVGAGHINFEEIIETLIKVNYDGFVSGEILPLPDPDTAAEKNIKFLSEIVK